MKHRLEFGGIGHSAEYVLNVAGYDHDHDIPDELTARLAGLLPEWEVCNRGSRIEITSGRFRGYRDDSIVVQAIQNVIAGELWFIGDVAEKKSKLPMLLVIDEPHFVSTGAIRLVKCAILRVRGDNWHVKPIEAPYFNPKECCDVPTAFHMDLWVVSKTNSSAQQIDELLDLSCLPLRVMRGIEYDSPVVVC
jgi:hypothetical protein